MMDEFNEIGLTHKFNDEKNLVENNAEPPSSVSDSPERINFGQLTGFILGGIAGGLSLEYSYFILFSSLGMLIGALIGRAPNSTIAEAAGFSLAAFACSILKPLFMPHQMPFFVIFTIVTVLLSGTVAEYFVGKKSGASDLMIRKNFWRSFASLVAMIVGGAIGFLGAYLFVAKYDFMLKSIITLFSSMIFGAAGWPIGGFIAGCSMPEIAKEAVFVLFVDCVSLLGAIFILYYDGIDKFIILYPIVLGLAIFIGWHVGNFVQRLVESRKKS